MRGGGTTLGEIRLAGLGAAKPERAGRLLATHLAFSLILHDRMADRGVFPDARAFFEALPGETQRDPAPIKKPKTRSTKVPSWSATHGQRNMASWIHKAYGPKRAS